MVFYMKFQMICKKALASDKSIIEKWNKLTPIQRNVWICWVTIVKKSKTR